LERVFAMHRALWRNARHHAQPRKNLSANGLFPTNS
jgi:hypothetical protein